MAVKKTAPKAGAAKKAKAKPAAKKAAPKAKAPKAGAKKAAPKKAAPKAKAAKMGAKKAAPKKASVKLTDDQRNMLGVVAAKGEAGLLSDKGSAKHLTALHGKKLVKKGKKGDGGFLYHITKLGQKHSAPAAPSGTSSAS